MHARRWPRVFAVLSATALAAACSSGGGTSKDSAVVAATCTSSQPSDPVSTPPDLTGWSLFLPVNAQGRLTGTAASVTPAAATPPWLATAPDGSLDFWAPAGGARTQNSQHSRTELERRDTFGAGTQAHTLRGTVTVDQLPDSRNIVVGQIHGADSISSVPFVMLHYRDGGIDVEVKNRTSGSSAHDYKLLRGVPLHARFTYTIAAGADGTLTFSATCGTTATATTTVPKAFAGKDVRFSAGDYQQDTTSAHPGVTGGRVTFGALSAD